LTNFIFRQWYWLFLLLLTLNACTGVTVKEPGPDDKAAYQHRTGQLKAIAHWGLVGKISLDDGDRGGSGRLQWDVKPGQSELDFHGALGRGAWHLQIGAEGALLKMADGSEETAASVSELFQDSVGWSVPIEALQWWVRGLAAPGAIESQQLGAGGLLVSLRQFGWDVDFNRYDSVGDIGLPVRLNATRDQYRVKLAVRHWRMDQSHDLTD
jgi:outer membrane lipoprotein LolB